MTARRASAVLIVAAAVGGCGARRHDTASSSGPAAELGRPIVTAPVASTTTVVQQLASSHPDARPRTSEHINLPATPQRTSVARAVRAVVTQFAQAYLSYQIGQDPPAVLAAIRTTCTPQFARQLLAQPAKVPPAQRNNPAFAPATLTAVSYSGSVSFGPGVPLQIALATYQTAARPPVRGALMIEVAQADSAWLVSAVRPQ